MLEEVIGRDPAVPAQMRDGAAEIDGVPVHDGADDEIEAGGAEGQCQRKIGLRSERRPIAFRA